MYVGIGVLAQSRVNSIKSKMSEPTETAAANMRALGISEADYDNIHNFSHKGKP